MPNAHNGSVDTDFVGGQYEANCSCGWQSLGHDTKNAALEAINAHYDEVAL